MRKSVHGLVEVLSNMLFWHGFRFIDTRNDVFKDDSMTSYIEAHDKGKPRETGGHKATGLKTVVSNIDRS